MRWRTEIQHGEWKPLYATETLNEAEEAIIMHEANEEKDTTWEYRYTPIDMYLGTF